MFQREDWTLFRNLNTLGQKAGVPKDRLAALVLKELVDNALDTGAACSVAYCEPTGRPAAHGVEYNVTDDGPGISGDDDELAVLFSIRRPLTSTKLVRLPTRGALGNGLRVVVGAVLASGGRLTVETYGRKVEISPQDDGTSKVLRLHGVYDEHALWGGGTIITVSFGPELAPKSPASALYMADLAIRMRGESSYGSRPAGLARNKFEGSSAGAKSSPHWYDADAFYDLCQASASDPKMDLKGLLALLDVRKLKDVFTTAEVHPTSHGKDPSTVALVDRGMALTDPYRADVRPTLKIWLDTKPSILHRATTDELLAQLRKHAPVPKASKLGVVGEHAPIPGLPQHGYAKHNAEITVTPGRSPLTADRLLGIVPAVIEVWVRRTDPKTEDRFNNGYGAQILVNRTPVTAKVSAGKESKSEMHIFGCGLHHKFKTGKHPLFITLCVTTPYMPITTDGKEPNLEPLAGAIIAAIEQAARRARKNAPTVDGVEGAGATQAQIIRDHLDEAIATASGAGDSLKTRGNSKSHRFSLRQLYYAIRPFVLASRDEFSYTTFASIVTDIEAEQGHDIEGMYRDARGTLYLPHQGDPDNPQSRESAGTMSLGTLNVERFVPPKWTINKVLYIEKGGFLPLLLDAKWAERHDCAILTSQGFATRAARDIIDLLGDSGSGSAVPCSTCIACGDIPASPDVLAAPGEYLGPDEDCVECRGAGTVGDQPLQFFAVHDGDASGSLIYQALTETTKARPGRKVEVINLGLDPWEAHDMGLQSEAFTRKAKGQAAVAEYVHRHDRFQGGGPDGESWAEWLQGNRYELNAMTSPQFLSWLDTKMVEHASYDADDADGVLARAGGKVVPPSDVLHTKFQEAARKAIRDRLVERAIKAYGVDGPGGHLERLMLDAEPQGAANVDLQGVVADLVCDTADTWKVPLRGLADEAADVLIDNDVALGRLP